jgi:hypothetical protein
MRLRDRKNGVFPDFYYLLDIFAGTPADTKERGHWWQKIR